MSAVAAPAKVLVTGASGFLAAHVVNRLLKDGYEVVGTVRSSPKGEYLKNLFKDFGAKFSYVIVPDIEKEDAFDEAVKGVDGVLHTASPFHFVADDPKELIGPAVQGTVGILKSVTKNGSAVKRVVVTSSAAAIVSSKDKHHVFTEADWNDESPAAVEKFGSKALGSDKYRASKTLAEKAAWEYVQKNASAVSFDLVTVNPPFIFGPTIHEIHDVNSLNESNSGFYKALINTPAKETAAAYVGNWVDVRDVAVAHSRALSVNEASGQRFLTSAGPFSWQDVYDVLREAQIANIPEGYPGTQDRSTYRIQDGAKATRVLGIKYTTLKESSADTINSIRERFPSDTL